MKPSNFRSIAILLALAIVTTSCTTEENEPITLEKESLIVQSKSVLEYDKLSELYLTLDQEILNSENEALITEYIVQKNKEVIHHLKSNFSQFEDASMEDASNLGVFYLGLAHAIAMDQGKIKGKSLALNDVVAKSGDWFDCLADLAAGYFSIDRLVQEYVTLFTQGASWNTVWPVVRSFVRRYAGWVAVAYFAYEFISDCT